MPPATVRSSASSGSNWWKLLLISPFIALLWVPFYNRINPALWGIPFFYWYQFLWVILTSAIILLVHNRTREPSAAPPHAESQGRRP
ncbi:MAG: hypothetical protein QOG83_812 [Alphaproteobacteria bacterium]|nr:hypothetical protein [Alphaproteobacteria bacterium]